MRLCGFFCFFVFLTLIYLTRGNIMLVFLSFPPPPFLLPVQMILRQPTNPPYFCKSFPFFLSYFYVFICCGSACILPFFLGILFSIPPHVHSCIHLYRGLLIYVFIFICALTLSTSVVCIQCIVLFVLLFYAYLFLILFIFIHLDFYLLYCFFFFLSPCIVF